MEDTGSQLVSFQIDGIYGAPHVLEVEDSSRHHILIVRVGRQYQNPRPFSEHSKHITHSISVILPFIASNYFCARPGRHCGMDKMLRQDLAKKIVWQLPCCGEYRRKARRTTTADFVLEG